MPTLKIDPRDILDVFGRNRFEIRNYALRVAFPRQSLEVRLNAAESMHRDFARPGEICVGRRCAGDRLDPVQNLCALSIGRMNLERRTLARVNSKRNLRPPARFDNLQIENCFENEESGKVSAGNVPSRSPRFARRAAFESVPKLAAAVQRGHRTEYKN